MPLVADRVAETTTTTGTGTVTLAGAKTGYQAFTTAFSTGAKVYYCITDNTNWEVGVGTFTTVGTTLSRDSIFASSNAGAAVNWGAGTRDVFCTAPMQSIVGAPRLQDKTGAYTVVASDNGSIINCTSGTFTVSLTAAATLGSGFTCWIWNTGTGVITIDPNASETIDGLTTIILRQGEGNQIVCDGTNWLTGDKKRMRGYAENLADGATRPVASGAQSIALGAAQATNTTDFAAGNGAIASGSASIALGRDAQSSGIYSAALGTSSGVAGARSVGSGAVAIGGSRASGTDSFAAAIANNTSTYGATGANAVAVGYLAKATGAQATAIGASNSETSVASADGAFAAAGATASGIVSIAVGRGAVASATATLALGRGNSGTSSNATTNQGATCISGGTASGVDSFAAVGGTASQQNSVAFGPSNSAIRGKFAYSSIASTQQTANTVLARTTTDATSSVLTSDAAAGGATNQVILPNSSAYAFTGTVVARRQAAGGTESAAWKIEGLIRREGTAASTTLVASTVTAISNAPGWTLALSADTTNGGLAITATGAAATNIRWVATVQTSEVTYA